MLALPCGASLMLTIALRVPDTTPLYAVFFVGKVRKMVFTGWRWLRRVGWRVGSIVFFCLLAVLLVALGACLAVWGVT